jgi:hypothetical protein
MYSRSPLPNSTAMKFSILLICIFAGTVTVSASFAQTKNDKRIKQLESERNRLGKLTSPEDRAESLMKIADITLTFVNDAIAANDNPRLTISVDEYRRTLTVARDTMMESGLDAYKKPKGYQAIELATRAHLRILEDFSRRLSLAERRPVEEVIEHVLKVRNEIVRVLFS